jgi:hypothetical protein
MVEIKELEKILKLCRKQGVTEIDLGDVKFKLGDLPAPKSSSSEETIIEQDIEEDPYAYFPQGILTSEQLAHYASGGSPSDDPVLAAQ